MAGKLARIALLVAGTAACVLWAPGGSRFLGFLVAAAVWAGLFLALVVLSRLAHRAFELGDHRQAGLLYRVLRVFVFDRGARASIDVSLAGCLLAAGDFARALAELERIDPARLIPPARAAWLNNKAYARARGAIDPSAGLAEIDEAMKLRPDVPGYRHTRGVVLLALQRLDDAIGELDAIWPHLADERVPSPELEAERCCDLGDAWARKGELDYARDYYRRARSIGGKSPWARRASEWLDRHPGVTRVDADSLRVLPVPPG